MSILFLPRRHYCKNGWKMRFIDVRIADVCVTGSPKSSAKNRVDGYRVAGRFSDPNDRSKTVEGYPAPQRAVLIA